MANWNKLAQRYGVINGFQSTPLDEPQFGGLTNQFSVGLKGGEVTFSTGGNKEVDEPEKTGGFDPFDLDGEIFGLKTKYVLAVAAIYFFFVK